MAATKCKRCAGTGVVLSGAELRQMREQAKLTLAQLAEKMDFSESYLSEIETGSRNVSREIEELYRKYT